MIDVLSGGLSGSEFLDGAHGPYDPVNRSDAGHFMLAVNVAALQPLAEFEARMETDIDRLHAVPLAPGHEQVFCPGELEALAERRNLAQGGIALADATRVDLMRIADESGTRALLPFDR